jgi:uncharacterized protein (TIGR02679 family)
MNTGADDRLQRLLGGDRLAGLRKRLRRRFERAAPDQADDSFRVTGLTADEHAALASLSGRRPRFSGSLQIDLAGVDVALREAGIAASLRAALEQLDGPIVHLATAREEAQRLWSGVADGRRDRGLRRFLEAPAGLGLLKRLSGGDPLAAHELCDRVEAVLRCLPAAGLTRAQLAADVLGDPHALDNGRFAATLVLAARRQVAVAGGAIETDIPGEKARDVWAKAGILVNELARPVLFLNLPGAGPEQISGEPCYASLRRLIRSPPSWGVAGRTVYVCENPNLLAIAADRLGRFCPPIVCTDGMPAAAQDGLLSQLARQGANLWYHGDFDWAGLGIGNVMMRDYHARPWRFGAVDYRAAVRAAPRSGHRLKGAEVLASWDEDLAPVMREHQMAIAEEGVAASLLQDLERGAGSQAGTSRSGPVMPGFDD